MADRQLAQLNIATLLAPIDSPALAGFVAELDRINALAERSPGFVRRLQSEESGAPGALAPFDDDVIVNLSVWASVESLHDYVYRSAHAAVMSRRKEWFSRMTDAWTVLWWVPHGWYPTVIEAHARLERLRSDGAGPEAFTFKSAFAAPVTGTSVAGSPATRVFDGECPT